MDKEQRESPAERAAARDVPVEVNGPVYERVSDYDPVLRSHCRVPARECLYPNGVLREGSVRIV